MVIIKECDQSGHTYKTSSNSKNARTPTQFNNLWNINSALAGVTFWESNFDSIVPASRYEQPLFIPPYKMYGERALPYYPMQKSVPSSYVIFRCPNGQVCCIGPQMVLSVRLRSAFPHVKCTLFVVCSNDSVNE